jgi:RHS repeat-associated protein
VGQQSVTTNTYDGDGKRVSMAESTQATITYIYDVNRGLPVVLQDGLHKNVWGLGLAYTVDSGNNAQVYHADGLGSVRAVTDSTGTVIETYLTDAFGVPVSTQGSVAQPFQFTGEQRDADGLLYLRARFDDPATGRFVSRDPVIGSVGAPQSLNRSVYAQNNPMLSVDPSGLKSQALSQSSYAVDDPTGSTTSTMRLQPLSVALPDCGGDAEPVPDPNAPILVCFRTIFAEVCLPVQLPSINEMPRKRRVCTSKCYVEGPFPWCSGRVSASAVVSGNDDKAACAEAQQAANSLVPSGCKGKHCQCTCGG